MSSTKNYLLFILDQLSSLQGISYRAMMGEYIIDYQGKVVGGLYDDQLLVKPISSAINYMKDVNYALPYEGGKEMLLVDDVDNREYLSGLFEAMFEELPEPKPGKKK